MTLPKYDRQSGLYARDILWFMTNISFFPWMFIVTWWNALTHEYKACVSTTLFGAFCQSNLAEGEK